MFENVIGHEQLRTILAAAIAEGTLPPAVLLSGPRFVAKTTIALEMARALTCHGEGAWACSCPACLRQRSLQHQGTLLLGPRSFALDIHAAAEAYRREPRTGTRFLLVRAVRRLTRRFDPALWEERRLKELSGPVGTLEALLEEFEIDRGDERAETKTLKEIEKQVARLLGSLPHDIVPVSVVRALANWAHTTGGSENRVVIIEEAHTMSKASRNAMLKILEEPPTGIHFVLTSSRRRAIIPTILSRVRTYEVAPRPLEDDVEVLRRIFRVENERYRSLSDFFRSYRGETDDRYRSLARAILKETPGDAVLRRELQATVLEGDARENAQYLLETMAEYARQILPESDGATAQRLVAIRDEINDAWSRIETRNMNPGAVLEAMVIRLRSEHVVERCADS